MNNEGKILESAVKLSDLTAEKIAMKSNMSKTQLYRLFKREVIDDYNKKCLLKAGIDVNELARKKQFEPTSDHARMYVDDLIPAIMLLREQVKLIQEEWKFLLEEQKVMKERVLEVYNKQSKKQKS